MGDLCSRILGDLSKRIVCYFSWRILGDLSGSIIWVIYLGVLYG